MKYRRNSTLPHHTGRTMKGESQMNFHETKMGTIFFNHQIPELIKALREIAMALSKPAPAAIQLAETGGT